MPQLEVERLPGLRVVVNQSGGLSSLFSESPAPEFTYGVTGDAWPYAPDHVQAWRARNDRLEVRWVFPDPGLLISDALGLEPLEAFEAETRILPEGGRDPSDAYGNG